MTHRRTTTAPRMEEAASLQIAGQLPGAVRELPLPNGTIADLAAPYWIAEIEPTRRWQHGLAQILEYWDQALRSPRPLLILIRDGTNTASRQHRRIERIAHSVGASVWTWDPHTGRFLTGGPAAPPPPPRISPPVYLDRPTLDPRRAGPPFMPHPARTIRHLAIDLRGPQRRPPPLPNPLKGATPCRPFTPSANSPNPS
jgi:hypothetical protein